MSDAQTLPEAVPVTILTGFLGAGKTTLLSRLLAEPEGERIGVLVNDFGAINIDAELIAEASADRVALTNGCVCCSIRDDLLAAVSALLEGASPPDRLVIEASGVSRPLAITEALEDAAGLRVDGVFCVIDASGFETLDYADTELAMDQAFGSDVAFLNKADLVDAATLARIDATLRAAMPRLKTTPTRHADAPRALLFGPAVARGAPERDHGGRGRHHADAFESVALTSTGALSEAAFRAAAAVLPAGLLRAKGVLNLDGRRGVFQLVGKRRTLVLDAGPAPTENRLVAISRAGALDREALRGLIAPALVQEVDEPGARAPS